MPRRFRLRSHAVITSAYRRCSVETLVATKHVVAPACDSLPYTLLRAVGLGGVDKERAQLDGAMNHRRVAVELPRAESHLGRSDAALP